MTRREKAIFMIGYGAGITQERGATAAERRMKPGAIVANVFAKWHIDSRLFEETIYSITSDLRSLPIKDTELN